MARPFLKWAGGKTQLLSILLNVVPKQTESYYEPFLGGGALFFALAEEGRFHQATLNDFNPDLVETYRAIRDSPEEVIDLLKAMPFSPELYESLRRNKPDSPAERAARIIYLNKTTYNGLYRVNQKGEFNAPIGDFGGREPRILDAPNLRDVSRVLSYGVGIYTGDFVQAVAGAREGDFVYFDPPYVPLNTTSSFTTYTRDGFTLDDQRRLAFCIRDLTHKGVKIIASNSDTATVRSLYQDFGNFDIHSIPVRRPINSVGTARGFVEEVLIFNFPDPERHDKLAQAAAEVQERRDKKAKQTLPLEGQTAFELAMELGWEEDD